MLAVADQDGFNWGYDPVSVCVRACLFVYNALIRHASDIFVQLCASVFVFSGSGQSDYFDRAVCLRVHVEMRVYIFADVQVCL